MPEPERKMSFPKSPPELVDRFGVVMTRFPDLEQRKMFGYPAAFLKGLMVTSLFGPSWAVRLPDDARAELMAIPGAAPLEPMPGRPMREYVAFPPDMLDDPDSLVPWIGRARDYTRSLPPKAKKAKSRG